MKRQKRPFSPWELPGEESKLWTRREHGSGSKNTSKGEDDSLDSVDPLSDLSIEQILADVKSRKDLLSREKNPPPAAVFEDAVGQKESRKEGQKEKSRDTAATAVIRDPVPRSVASPPPMRVEVSGKSGKASRGAWEAQNPEKTREPSLVKGEEPAAQAIQATPATQTAQTFSQEPRQEEKKEKKEKKGWFRRRKEKKQEAFLPEDDPYYGLKLKPLEEYRKQYQESLEALERPVSPGKSDMSGTSRFSYLYSDFPEGASPSQSSQPSQPGKPSSGKKNFSSGEAQKPSRQNRKKPSPEIFSFSSQILREKSAQENRLPTPEEFSAALLAEEKQEKQKQQEQQERPAPSRPQEPVTLPSPESPVPGAPSVPSTPSSPSTPSVPDIPGAPGPEIPYAPAPQAPSVIRGEEEKPDLPHLTREAEPEQQQPEKPEAVETAGTTEIAETAQTAESVESIENVESTETGETQKTATTTTTAIQADSQASQEQIYTKSINTEKNTEMQDVLPQEEGISSREEEEPSAASAAAVLPLQETAGEAAEKTPEETPRELSAREPAGEEKPAPVKEPVAVPEAPGSGSTAPKVQEPEAPKIPRVLGLEPGSAVFGLEHASRGGGFRYVVDLTSQEQEDILSREIHQYFHPESRQPEQPVPQEAEASQPLRGSHAEEIPENQGLQEQVEQSLPAADSTASSQISQASFEETAGEESSGAVHISQPNPSSSPKEDPPSFSMETFPASAVSSDSPEPADSTEPAEPTESMEPTDSQKEGPEEPDEQEAGKPQAKAKDSASSSSSTPSRIKKDGLEDMFPFIQPIDPRTREDVAAAAGARAAAAARDAAKQAQAASKKKRKKGPSFQMLGGDEPENRPEEDYETQSQKETPTLEDYTQKEDAPAIWNELKTSSRALLIRTCATGLLTVVVAALEIFGGRIPEDVLPLQLRILLCLLGLGVGILFSLKAIRSGLKGLFTLKANGDSGMALSACVLFLHPLALLFFPDRMAGQGAAFLSTYCSVGILGIFLNSWGKLLLARRMCGNFKYLTESGSLYGVKTVEDVNTAMEMAQDCVPGVPVAAYQRKADFLHHFLRNSQDPDPSDFSAQTLAPVGLISSLILAGVCFYLNRDTAASISAFAAGCAIFTPMMNLLTVQLPLRRIYRLGKQNRSMLVGYTALDTFSDVNAVVVDSAELFPPSTLVLGGIRTFGDQRVDSAILDATALTKAVGGSLSDLFGQVIRSQAKILPKAENVSYEDGMGIVGWVSGRRTLVGNRELMEKHGIEPPSRDYEKQFLTQDRSHVYLASGGEVVAMFLITYTASPKIAGELQRLEDHGVSILVRTCDPNITPDLISRRFDLDTESIRILPDKLGRPYHDRISDPDPAGEATLATRGRFTSMARMLVACIRQRGNISMGTALQAMCNILGFVLTAFLVCCSALYQLSAGVVLLYFAFWILAALVVPALRKS